MKFIVITTIGLLALAGCKPNGLGLSQTEFKVFLHPANTLHFVKEPCDDSDTEPRFFVHVFPATLDDLPPHRRPNGFDNLDFSFSQNGTLSDGKCMATVRLPEYEAARIATGQYLPEGQLWKTEMIPPSGGDEAQPSQFQVDRTTKLQSHYYVFDTRTIQLENFAAVGGAMTTLHDDLLVATPKGRFALIGVNGMPRYLTGRVPMNESILESHEVSSDPEFEHYHYNVTDVMLKERSYNQFDLFVSHHYFTGSCFVLRISATTLSSDNGQATISPFWRTIYDTKPCLTPTFVMRQSGGALLLEGADHLLLTVGDFGRIRGTNGSLPEPQDPDISLGKIMRIAVETGQAQVFSSGLRNPSGLARDSDGNIWATEHGPRGGDELNLFEQGNNYGWPYVTDGDRYRGTDELPRQEVDGTVAPAFAWVPSIGISSLIANDENVLPLWKNDLLATSLRGRSQQDFHGRAIFRIRREDQTVRYVEKIGGDSAIRDIAMLSGGRLALLLDRESRLVFLTVSGLTVEQPKE